MPIKVEIKKVKLSKIKLNPNNPRKIDKNDMDKLVKSLTVFPEMRELREIVVDDKFVILGGNMRYQALKKIGEKDCIVKIVNGLTEAQKREFVIKDNSNFGQYDFDILSNGWSDLQLDDWGVKLPEDWIKEDDSLVLLENEELDKGGASDHFYGSNSRVLRLGDLMCYITDETLIKKIQSFTDIILKHDESQQTLNSLGEEIAWFIIENENIFLPKK